MKIPGIHHQLKLTQRLWYLLLPFQRKQFIWSLALILVNTFFELAGLGLLIPFLMVILSEDVQATVDKLGLGLQPDRATLIMAFSVFILFVFLVKGLVFYYVNRKLAWFTYSVQQTTSRNLLRDLLYSDLKGVQLTDSNMVLRDVNRVPGLFATHIVHSLLSFWSEVLVILMIAVSILFVEWRIIPMLCLTLLPVTALFYRYSKRRLSEGSVLMHELTPETTRVVYDSLFGFIDIKLSGSEAYVLKRYNGLLNRIITEHIQIHALRQLPNKVVEMAVVVTLLIIVVLGAVVLGNTEYTLTILGVLMVSAYRVMPSVNRLMQANMAIQSHLYTFDVMEKLRRVPTQEIKKEVAPDKRFALFDNLALRNVGYHYPKSKIAALSNIDLEVKRGENVGVIGRSGSGKTTLLKLLASFFEPTEGNFLVNNVTINDQTRSAWWRLIGYVQQEVFLSEATLAENVAFGIKREDIDREKLARVIAMAGLREFVDSLPEQENAVIRERGKNLSGGQKQRIGIARALYSGAQVFLFDEATSALDHETEQLIVESIRSLNEGGYTTITVAHRITTLKHCGRIIQLEEGRMVGSFSYEELFAKMVKNI